MSTNTTVYFTPDEVREKSVVQTAVDYARANGFYPVPRYTGWDPTNLRWVVELRPLAKIPKCDHHFAASSGTGGLIDHCIKCGEERA